MPLTGELRDSFDDNTVDPVKWPNNFNTMGALPTETGGRARVPCDTGFAGYSSDTIYTLASSSLRCRVFPPSAGGGTEVWAQLLVTSSTSGTDAVMEVDVATGELTMANRSGFSDPGAAVITYDPVDHAWLRIREGGGTLFFDTSADGVAWTSRHSDTSPGWVSDTDIEMQMLAHRDAGTADFAEFDNFNITPSSAVFADLTDDFDDDAVDPVKWPENYNTGSGGLPTETGGRARVPCDTGFAAYASAPIYRLESSYAFAQAFPPPGTEMLEAYCQLLILSNVTGTQIVFEVDAATNILLMTVHIDFNDEGGRTVPYDPVEHAWLRVREDGGTLFWETAPDGRQWTVRHSDTAPSWVSDNDLQAQLLAHCAPMVTGGGPTGEFAEFDNFNVRPALADGYSVLIDWNGDGDFEDTAENVTNDVLRSGPVTFEYGRDQARALSPPQVGTLSFELCNADGTYSPEVTGSPIAADIEPAAPIEVSEVIDDVEYPLMTGRIDTFRVNTDRGQRSVSISALDDLALLKTKITTEVYHGKRTGTLIGVILDEVGWTAPRDIDLGATHVPWWWVSNDDAFAALTELLASEGPPSIAYVAPDGTFVFRDRHHRIQRAASVNPQATFAAQGFACDAPAVTGFSYIDDFEYEYGWKDIVNDVIVPVDERGPEGLLSEVWESDDLFTLSIGESRDIRIQASNPFVDARDIDENEGDIVFTGAGVPLTVLSARSGQSVTLTITAAGGGITVSHLALRARAVPVERITRVVATDSTSITRHGRRTYPDDIPWVNANDALAVATLLLIQYAERRPVVQLPLVSCDLPHHLQVATRSISDRITIRNDDIGLDRDFFIERIAQTLARMTPEDECPGPVHYATLGCELTGETTPANPFTFDKAGAGFDDGVFSPSSGDDPDTVFIFDHPVQGQFGTGQFGT